MGFDSPWKIAALVGSVAALRLVWSFWKHAPARRSFLELYDSFLIALVLVFLIIRPFVVQAFYIPSESMVPTLNVGDRILVNKFIYRLAPPKRGDVIVFKAPYEAAKSSKEVDFIKRLIGLPGDRVKIVAYDGVYVNGVKIPDDYTTEAPDKDYPPPSMDGPKEYRVPKGTFFVMGDDRNGSNDSRSWGPLPKANVRGKAMAIFLPPGRISLISDSQVLAQAPSDDQGGAAASHPACGLPDAER